MKRAYVMLTVNPQRMQSVTRMAQRMPNVKRVDVVSGPYDIMVVIEAETFDTLSDFIISQLRTLDGIEHTETWLVMQ